MQRLKSFYLKNVVIKLKEKFLYSNDNEIPKIQKIIINRGFDESCQNTKVLENLLMEFKMICGQTAVVSKSKKAIASFKIKENMAVGMFVTLRGEKMYSFLDRLINLALPRIRDFQGLSTTSFDKQGNYTLGLTEQIMFPELDFDKITKIEGMDICIVTNSKSREQSLFLLKELGMPFKN
uniref:ribosomal protein L5 n=1 Tax=Euglena deses TaxID=66845 RepID=UPI0023AAA5CA|nr:ribosomal protein L5 [Euglena deses]WCH63374.1 ribosomal protein L5 [Euglena deses]